MTHFQIPQCLGFTRSPTSDVLRNCQLLREENPDSKLVHGYSNSNSTDKTISYKIIQSVAQFLVKYIQTSACNHDMDGGEYLVHPVKLMYIGSLRLIQ